LFLHGSTALLGLGLLIVEVLPSHSHTLHTQRNLTKHNTQERKTTMPRWYSNPQSQQWAAADLRLRPRGHRNQLQKLGSQNFEKSAYEAGKVVSTRHQTSVRPFPQENIPDTHISQRLSRTQDHSTAERIMSMKNSNDNWNPTRDLLQALAQSFNLLNLE